MRALRLLSMLAILTACTAKESPTADTSAPAAADDDAVRAQVDSVRTAWKTAADRKDAAAIAAMYTDDAIMVGGQSPAATGRSEIQNNVNGLLTAGTVESIDSKETVVGGDVAYDYGTYRMTVTQPNQQPQTVIGHYVVILRRQADGTWKIVRHIDTVPPPKS